MTPTEVVEYDWPYLLTFLPPEEELDRSAQALGALTRKRQITQASTLLRLAFVYGFCGMSLRQTTAWAEERHLATLSDVALLKRLRSAGPWLESLVATKLANAAATLPPASRAFPIRLVDATCISRPRSRGTDWRVHLGFDLVRLTINHIDLTDHTGGETLRRFTWSPGELVLADRGYAHRPGLEAVLAAGADFLVRMPWQNVPLRQRAGAPFELFPVLRALPDTEPGDFPVTLVPSTPRTPARALRLLALRKSETAAANARHKVLEDLGRRGRTVDARSLEAAGYILLLTSLPAERLPAEAGLELYRYRWQIELAFKRLKTLVHLDVLPVRDAALARSLLAVKLLAALLLDDLTQAFLGFSPWGYRLRPAHPIVLADPALSA